jgi:hypothetical protein
MTETWVIPCNIKYFDVISHFKENKRVVWKNSFSIHKGDIVYLYLSSPYGEIRYKCIVINDSVDEEVLKTNSYAIPIKKQIVTFPKKRSTLK